MRATLETTVTVTWNVPLEHLTTAQRVLPEMLRSALKDGTAMAGRARVKSVDIVPSDKPFSNFGLELDWVESDFPGYEQAALALQEEDVD